MNTPQNSPILSVESDAFQPVCSQMREQLSALSLKAPSCSSTPVPPDLWQPLTGFLPLWFFHFLEFHISGVSQLWFFFFFLMGVFSLSIAFIHGTVFSFSFQNTFQIHSVGILSKKATHSVAPPLMTSLRSRQRATHLPQTRSQRTLPYRQR